MMNALLCLGDNGRVLGSTDPISHLITVGPITEQALPLLWASTQVTQTDLNH